VNSVPSVVILIVEKPQRTQSSLSEEIKYQLFSEVLFVRFGQGAIFAAVQKQKPHSRHLGKREAFLPARQGEGDSLPLTMSGLGL
jgi:hypothetical protein